MRATCPFCLAAYELPDAAQSARTLRCARCCRDWRPRPEAVVLPPEPPESDLADDEDDEVDPTQSDMPEPDLRAAEPLSPPAAPSLFREARSSRAALRIDPVLHPDPAVAAGLTVIPDHQRLAVAPRGGGGWVVSAWLLTVLVWIGLAWAAWVFRHPIMTAWPPSGRVYGLIAR